MFKEIGQELVRSGIPRRDFLALLVMIGTAGAFKSAADVAVPVYTAKQIIEDPLTKSLFSSAVAWGKQVPPFMPEVQRQNPLEGGFPETSMSGRPPFLEGDNGHRDFLKFMCLNQPVIRDTLGYAFTDFLKTPTDVPRLGTLLRKHREFARKALIKHTRQTNSEEEVHIAVYTIAAILSPYFSTEDVKSLNLGIAIPPMPMDDKIFSSRDYFLRLPRVYPVEESHCLNAFDVIVRCIGIDRAVHFAQYFFLAYQYLYALRHNLQDAKRIPNGARLMVDLFGLTDEMKATILNKLGQYYWEGKETVERREGLSPKDPNGDFVPTGFLDDLLLKDFDGNDLGLEAGLKLTGIAKRLGRNLDKKSIERFNQDFEYICRWLDREEIYKVAFKPGVSTAVRDTRIEAVGSNVLKVGDKYLEFIVAGEAAPSRRDTIFEQIFQPVTVYERASNRRIT